MVICPDCGKEVPKEKFCKNCGAYLANIEEAKPAVENDSLPGQSSQIPAGNEVAVSPQAGAKFCHNCGNSIAGDFKFCPSCGQDLRSNVSNSIVISHSAEKNVLLAVILSVFLPGLGQIYLGLDQKGSIFLIAYVVSAILILILIGFLLCFVIWIWALIDTIISANALNRGDEIQDKLF